MAAESARAVVRRIIASPKAPKGIGPYNQAVQVNHTLYLSGQIGMDPKTQELVSDDVADQARQVCVFKQKSFTDGFHALFLIDIECRKTFRVLTNLNSVLEAAGSSLQKVVKTTVLFADLKDYQAVNEVYAQFFTSNQPARAAYQVAALPKGAKVEIEAVAIVGDVEDASTK